MTFMSICLCVIKKFAFMQFPLAATGAKLVPGQKVC